MTIVIPTYLLYVGIAVMISSTVLSIMEIYYRRKQRRLQEEAYMIIAEQVFLKMKAKDGSHLRVVDEDA